MKRKKEGKKKYLIDITRLNKEKMTRMVDAKAVP